MHNDNIFNRIGRWLSYVGRGFANQWRLVTGDIGVLMFFVALPLLYPIVYTLIYNPEVVRRLPVAVVDNSRSEESRRLIQLASGAPSIEIYSYDSNLADAKKRMANGEVFAIMEIPRNYARDLETGVPTTVPVYFDMSLLLRYRALLSAMTDLQLEVISETTSARLATMGAESLGITSLPVNNHSNFLGDTQQGFASFVMPGILMLILQQSMVLGIMLIEGTSRERRRRNGGIDPMLVQGAPVGASMIGKTLCYLVAYIPMSLYALHVVPEMFSLPHIGRFADYMLLLLPMLTASSFFGMTLSLFAKERESTFMIVVFTSVVFLFLSGLTWPRYAMSEFWRGVGDLVPATWGVEAFIRINSNGATLADCAADYKALWLLTAGYFVTAWFVNRYIRRKGAL